LKTAFPASNVKAHAGILRGPHQLVHQIRSLLISVFQTVSLMESDSDHLHHLHYSDSFGSLILLPLKLFYKHLIHKDSPWNSLCIN